MTIGEIKDLVRKYDWALILFDKPQAAENAVKEMDGIYIDDAKVTVTMAQKGGRRWLNNTHSEDNYS